MTKVEVSLHGHSTKFDPRVGGWGGTGVRTYGSLCENSGCSSRVGSTSPSPLRRSPVSGFHPSVHPSTHHSSIHPSTHVTIQPHRLTPSNRGLHCSQRGPFLAGGSSSGGPPSAGRLVGTIKHSSGVIVTTGGGFHIICQILC